MAHLKSVALALAVSVFGVSIVSSTAHADPAQSAPPNKAATTNEKAANRNDYLIKVMTNQGFTESKAKRVVAAITRYQTDFRRTHQDISHARVLLRDDNTANDKAAQARIDADKKKLERLKERYKAEIARILTPAEQNKLAQILAPPKPKAKRGKGHQKPKHNQQAQKRS